MTKQPKPEEQHFEVLTFEERQAAMRGVKDILAPAAAQLDVSEQKCPKCKTPMHARRPEELFGVVPAFDFVCPACKTVKLGSGTVISG